MMLMLKQELARETSLHREINKLKGDFGKLDGDLEAQKDQMDKQQNDLMLRLKERENKRKQRE